MVNFLTSDRLNMTKITFPLEIATDWTHLCNLKTDYWLENDLIHLSVRIGMVELYCIPINPMYDLV